MKKILVVEDSDDVRENLVDLLLANEYSVEYAENGYDGYKKALSILPDLIIADIMMPMMDGLEMLKLLRENISTQNIPFIFLSAKSSINEIRTGMNTGADDYLTKPFHAKEILQAVEVRLEKKERLDKKFENTYKTISGSIPHELRTPLASIIGFTNILIEDIDIIDKSETKDILFKMKYSSLRLHKTIEKFILFNEAELINGNKKNYDILLNKKTVIQEFVLDYLVHEKLKVVDAKIPVIISPVSANVKMMEEHFNVIFSELIENAIKFSTPNKPIEITSFDEEEHITIKVKNYGRGMTPEEIESTAPFVQHNRHYFEQQGSGLGLIIVKRLCEFYDADFSIESMPNEYLIVSIKLKKSCCSHTPFNK